MPTSRSRSIPRAASLEPMRKKILASVEKASMEELSPIAADDIARLLGSASIRLFHRDALSDELYCRYAEAGGETREIRVNADPSSVVGYAAMTRNRAFAWNGGPPNRQYVVAAPLVAGS